MAFHKVIGIDLGTTYSAVSVWDGTDVVVIATIPSVVGLDADRKVIVGVAAQNRLVVDPENTVVEVKRLMGAYERQPSPSDDPGVPARIRFRGRDYLPQEITAFILKEHKRQAEEYIGEPVHDAVITVPAYFREPQRRATEDAAHLAGLNVRRLINEPTAAAVGYGVDEVHTCAVYDLGGGTFDVSVIQIRPGNVTVVGTGGDPHLGGSDFDDRIVDWAVGEIRRIYGVDLGGDGMARHRILREAERRKRELSTATATALALPYLTRDLSATVPFTRTVFEGLIADLLERSLFCLDEAMDSARERHGIERGEISQVLLVGGSTRIAKVRPMLASHLGMDLRDIRGDINADEAVVRGAGIVARDCPYAAAYLGPEIELPHTGQTESESPEILALQDVTSHSLGVLTEHDHFSVVLPKDSRIPRSATQHYTNAGPYTELDIMVFQGEHPEAFDNELVGTLPISFPEPRPRGYWDLAVTVGLTDDGLLRADVTCVNNGDSWQVELHSGMWSDRSAVEDSTMRAGETIAPRTPLPPPPPPPPPLKA